MVRFSPFETLPTRFLGSMGSPNPFSPSQPLPTPLLRKIQSSIRPMNLQTHGKQQTTKNKFANPKVKKYQQVRSCPATVLVLLALQNSPSKRLNLKLFLGWVRAPRGPPFYTRNWLSKRLNLKLIFWLGSRVPGGLHFISKNRAQTQDSALFWAWNIKKAQAGQGDAKAKNKFASPRVGEVTKHTPGRRATQNRVERSFDHCKARNQCILQPFWLVNIQKI